LLDALRVRLEVIALGHGDAGVVEREVHRRQRAVGVGWLARAAGLLAKAVDAVLVVLAVLVLLALRRRLARTGLAPAARAVDVRSARLALAGLTDLAGRALIVALALRLDDARVGLALLAGRALLVVLALDALVADAHAGLAVLVGLARSGLLGLAAAADRDD